MDLVSPEICTCCGRSIGAKQAACLWDEKIVCYKCQRTLSREAREQKAAEEAKWITQGQRDFLAGLGVNVPEKATREDAQRAFDALEHLRHFICGAWLNVSGRHTRECGLLQHELKVWSAQMAFDKPTAVDVVILRVKRGGHSKEFLKDADASCYELLEAAFLKFCKDTDAMQKANHEGEKCTGGLFCPDDVSSDGADPDWGGSL
jgi:hypothetical protein